MSAQHLMHEIDTTSSETMKMSTFMIFFVIALLVGTGIGYFISKAKKNNPTVLMTNADTGTKVDTDKAAGVIDKSTFKDKAEGIIREGGVGQDGSFHLERPGGESQTVALTSTTVDLSKYVGKKVRVWGSTMTPQTAGWYMDVGLVEIL